MEGLSVKATVHMQSNMISLVTCFAASHHPTLLQVVGSVYPL